MLRTSRFYILIALFALGACNSSHLAKQAGIDDNTKAEKAVLAPKSEINWPLMRDAILNECKDCHIKMKTYAGVAPQLVKIVSKVETGAMPPAEEGYAPLSACQVAVLKTWVALGAPPKSAVTVDSLPECAGLAVASPSPTPAPTPSAAPTPLPTPAPLPGPTPGGIAAMPLTYATLKSEILDSKCVRCHQASSSSDAKDTLFVPYDEITKRPDLWRKPGKDCKLVRTLTRTDGKRMPPPPRNSPLAQDEIDFIIRWVDAGLPQ